MYKSSQIKHHSSALYSFKKQEAVLSYIEIDVMISFICDIRPEISANESMPVSIILTVEFIFKMGCDLLDGMHFFEGIFSNSQNLSFHFWAYAFDFNNRTRFFYLGHEVSN